MITGNAQDIAAFMALTNELSMLIVAGRANETDFLRKQLSDALNSIYKVER